uniref:Uncharacterized protein n=1 Tax=Leersia perrieri TaxID=77586 RepID=A0A0D9Y123_9ORYZ
MSRRRERDPAFTMEVDRMMQGLVDADDDPYAAELRYARMSEADRGEIRFLRSAFVGLDRACRRAATRAPTPLARRRIISYRLEGGRLVKVSDGVGFPTDGGGVGESPSSSAAAGAGGSSEDELCSALRSAARV